MRSLSQFRTFIRLYFAIAALLLIPRVAIAQLPPPRPYHCIGWNPDAQSWAATGTPEYQQKIENPLQCPKGYAFFSTMRVTGDFLSEEVMPVVGNCCQLPDDVLSEEHTLEIERCPAEHVVTGAWIENYEECNTKACPKKWGHRKKGIRCTRINTGRYALGAQTPAAVWGWSKHLQDFIFWKRILRHQIPLGIRYGIGRREKTRWDYDGCIGATAGDLFVTRGKKNCPEVLTSQLQFRGIPGDPPAGTAVTVIRTCDAISDPLLPDAQCMVLESKE